MISSIATAHLAATPARSAAPRMPHVEFLGFPFSALTQRQVLDVIVGQCGAPYRYVVTPNAYHIVSAHDKPGQLLPLYRNAWLSHSDSRIVRALARLDRLAVQLVTGSDLVAALLATLDAGDQQ